MKIALVHDYLGEFGGAERVLLALSQMYPQAPIYTAFWRPGAAWDRFKHKDIRVSWAHHVPGFSTKLHSPFRFLAPSIWSSFDLSEYDVVLSSASWYITKGFGSRGTMRKKPIEICYCHTPPRWLYGYPTSIEWQRFRIVRAYAAIVGFFMRQYDFQAASRVDYFIANSKNTMHRIQKFYRRDSTVIYPPIDIHSHISEKKRTYYLAVSRIVGGKGLELAVQAAKKLKFPLKIVGAPAGYTTEQQHLRASAGNTVEFLGHVTDSELTRLYGGARAFFALATDEDFGMTPVEAMAAGTPVIAFRGGGYTETVVEGKTGLFFDEPTADSLVRAIDTFEHSRFSSSACRAQALKFSKKRFEREIRVFIESKLEQKM